MMVLPLKLMNLAEIGDTEQDWYDFSNEAGICGMVSVRDLGCFNPTVTGKAFLLKFSGVLSLLTKDTKNTDQQYEEGLTLLQKDSQFEVNIKRMSNMCNTSCILMYRKQRPHI